MRTFISPNEAVWREPLGLLTFGEALPTQVETTPTVAKRPAAVVATATASEVYLPQILGFIVFGDRPTTQEEVSLFEETNCPCPDPELPPEYLTSTIYPVVAIEEMDSSQVDLLYAHLSYSILDAMEASQVVVLEGLLRSPLIEYEMEPEAIDSAQVELLSGELRTLLLTTEMEPEALDVSQVVLLSGVLRAALIVYPNWPDEAIEASQVVLLSGSLT